MMSKNRSTSKYAEFFLKYPQKKSLITNCQDDFIITKTGFENRPFLGVSH